MIPAINVLANPMNWKLARFKYLASPSKGRLPPSGENESLNAKSAVPYLSMEYLRGDAEATTYVEPKGLVVAKDKDVLLLWDGSNAGEFLRAKYGVVSSTAALVDNIAIDRDYLFWISKAIEPVLRMYTNGMGIPHVDGEFLRNLRLLTPDSTNQRHIADYLDRETARIDALVAEKERMLALLEEKRDALISRAATRGLNSNALLKPSGLDWLDDIPAHWDICQLKRTWKSSDYGISESIRDEGEIAVLRMSCIVEGKVTLDKSGMVTEVDKALLLKRDDLLFNRTNSLDQIAKVGLVDFDPVDQLTFASYLVRIRTNQRALPSYLVYLLNSTVFLVFARKNAIPAIGQANLSPTRYGEIHIPLPPIDEQRQIVDLLNAEEKSSSALRLTLAHSIELLTERRSALITAAVTGQIAQEEMAA